MDSLEFFLIFILTAGVFCFLGFAIGLVYGKREALRCAIVLVAKILAWHDERSPRTPLVVQASIDRLNGPLNDEFID